MGKVYHALGLNMHQPPGNLLTLHNSNEQWEAKQILWCYDRPTRMLEGYEDVARLHMSFSGTLLMKQLEDPAVTETFKKHGIRDIIGAAILRNGQARSCRKRGRTKCATQARITTG
jgi:alpha-amylase/alpha-mannosidase (GH57 family)